MQIQYLSEKYEIDADSTCEQLYTKLLSNTRYKELYELWCNDEHIPNTNAGLDTTNIHDDCIVTYQFVDDETLIREFMNDLAKVNINGYVKPIVDDLVIHLIIYGEVNPDSTWWKSYITSYEIAATICNSNGRALEYVPNSMITSDLYMVACTSNGNALRYVPESMITSNLCIAACKNSGNALQYVPESMKTPDLCMVACKFLGYALKYVPESMKIPDLCMAACTSNGNALEVVPDVMKTSELCIAACKNSGKALRYVPESMKTPEFIAAVKRRG